MDPQFALMITAVLLAATLQAATGIGFGVIAGPILLALLNDVTAIQISIVLNLLIAVMLAPTVRHRFSRKLLPALAAGLALGSPLGVLVFTVISLTYLKILALAFVGFALLALCYGERLQMYGNRPVPAAVEQVAIGAIAGVMGSSLAMPGPVPAAWMSARGFDKATVRATILVMFVAAYGIALLLQLVTVGIAGETVIQCLYLAAPTIGGVLLGSQLSHRVSERTFRTLLIVVLIGTCATIVASI